MKYEVSLAIPIYNVAASIRKSLESALAQTFTNIEFLIVDDKGSDNSMEIVREIVSNHPKKNDVRIIEHTNNIGLGAARNTAIQGANSKYIYFMDSDDILTPDCIESLYNTMTEYPSDFIAGSFITIDEEGNKNYNKVYPKFTHLKTSSDILNYQLYANIPIALATWNKLYSLTFLKENAIRCSPNHLSDDQVFSFLILAHAESCILINKVTYYYMHNPFSLSARLRREGCNLKMVKEYADISDIKKRFLAEHSTHKHRIELYSLTIKYSFYSAFMAIESRNLNIKEKLFYIRYFLKYKSEETPNGNSLYFKLLKFYNLIKGSDFLLILFLKGTKFGIKHKLHKRLISKG